VASAPSGRPPVTGRVDREGRLIAADAELLRLQEEAGSKLGAPLALPQLAALVRSAIKLRVPLSRSVIAASAKQDLDLWVRADPDEEGASLTIDGWKERPPAPPRLTLVGSEPVIEDRKPSGLSFRTDSELRLVGMDEALARQLQVGDDVVPGQPLTRYFQLVDNGDGQMPLLTALGSRRDFEGQPVRLRGSEAAAILSGTAMRSPEGEFDGFSVRVAFAQGTEEDELPEIFDPALDEALRSPLDRIIAAADRIVDRSEGPLRSDYAAYAGDIAAAGRHLLSVIRSMTQQTHPVEGSVGLSARVGEAVQLVQARADERSILLVVQDSEESLRAAGEDRGVVQIIVNILGNAIRHSPAQGTILITLARRDGFATVTVADEGPGIAPDDQQRIFERYERVGDAPGGVGLGLAIARRLATSMGGTIELESAPGEGARFTLVLPAA
jgi:signal transduction histidine kinase